MLKLEHIGHDYNINYAKYLIDHNPGKNFIRKPYKIKTEDSDIFYEKLKKEFNLMLLFNDLYNEKMCIYKFESINKLKNYSTISFYMVEDFELISKIDTLVKDHLYSFEGREFPTINIITMESNYPELMEVELTNKIIIDKKNSYNTNFELDKVKSLINSDKSGLILFTGHPGSGKTSYIKYLSQECITKNFIFLPNTSIHVLSDPNFMSFATNNLANSIIILEDAENLLLDRKNSKTHEISNILNLTDGLLGSLLNIKIIATLNTTDKIDSALLRQGRLLARVDFEELSAEQATNLSKALGNNIEYTKPTPLCNVYNVNANGYEGENKNKLGF